MSKLYCAYDKHKETIADHKCDFCGKLLCSMCGFHDEMGNEYCNECWEKKLEKKSDCPEGMVFLGYDEYEQEIWWD